MVQRTALIATFIACLAPHGVAAQSCPPFDGPSTRAGTLEHDALTESSGLAASRRHDDVLWTHNDSGGAARLFAFRPDGAHLGVLKLNGVDAVDWEDMAAGPCNPEDTDNKADPCLYVGDFGDNNAKRSTVSIYRVAEPALPDTRPANLESDAVTRLRFRYEDGPRDAETLLVHPDTGKLYVISKNRGSGPAGVYRVPRSTGDATSVVTAERIAELPLKGRWSVGKMITAGDVAPSGDAFSIRTYTAVFTYCAGNGDFESAFSRQPAISSPPLTLQGEALAHGQNGEHLWLTSEKRPAPVIRMSRAAPEKASPKSSGPGDRSPPKATKPTRDGCSAASCGQTGTVLPLIVILSGLTWAGAKRRKAGSDA